MSTRSSGTVNDKLKNDIETFVKELPHQETKYNGILAQVKALPDNTKMVINGKEYDKPSLIELIKNANDTGTPNNMLGFFGGKRKSRRHRKTKVSQKSKKARRSRKSRK